MPRSPKSGPTPRFTFRLPPDLRRDLEVLARQDKRELGDYIRVTMERHAEENAERIRALRGAYPEPIATPAAAAEDASPRGTRTSDLAEEEERQQAATELSKALKAQTPPELKRSVPGSAGEAKHG